MDGQASNNAIFNHSPLPNKKIKSPQVDKD